MNDGQISRGSPFIILFLLKKIEKVAEFEKKQIFPFKMIKEQVCTYFPSFYIEFYPGPFLHKYPESLVWVG